MLYHTWEVIYGNQTVQMRSDYNVPYPGGVYRHGMVLDHADRFIYCFGGRGFDHTLEGICFI